MPDDVKSATDEEVSVGDLVEAAPGHALACGSGIYRNAVVVSVDPFALVSERGDMLWRCTQTPKTVRKIGRALQPKAAFRRWEEESMSDDVNPADDTQLKSLRKRAAHGEDMDCEEVGRILARLDAAEAQRDRLRTAIAAHRSQRGDDRCWLDDQTLYAVLGDGDSGDNSLPCRTDFLANCERYYDSRCRNAGWRGYQELEQDNARLAARVAELEGLRAAGVDPP